MIIALVTLLISGCSRPEEVISSRLAQATKDLEAGRVETALRTLEGLDERYPERPAVLEALGFAYVQAGRNTAAANVFIKAAEHDLASSSLRLLAAEALLKDGVADRATEQLRLYLAEYPGDFQVLQRLGETEESQGNLARAIDAYLESNRIQPSGETAYRLGVAFRRLNNLPQARFWFESAIRHADAHVDRALVGLLGIEMDTRDYAAAELTLGQLERNFPAILATLPDLPDYRADIETWKQTRAAVDAARAEQDALARELAATRLRDQQALGSPPPPAPPPTPAPPTTTTSAAPPPLAPEDTPALEAPPPATPDPEPATAAPAPEAAEPPPASPLPEYDAALVRRDAGDYAGAAELLETALSHDDSRPEVWAALADCHRLLKQYDAAEAYLLEARRRAPESLTLEIAFINLGREHLTTDAQLARLDQARRRFPTHVGLAYMLAHELAAARVDRLRTAAAYEDFLLLAPADDPRRQEAEAYLRRR